MGNSTSGAALILWPSRVQYHLPMDMSIYGHGWDMDLDSFNGRYRLCHKHLEFVEGGVLIRNQDMAERVAREMEVGSIGVNTASRWKKSTLPDPATIGAIARVCGVHVGWLVFGEEGGPPPAFVTRLPVSDQTADEG